MDSPIALAVMAKAKLVFEREDTFLSFPLSPVAYPREALAFGAAGAVTNQDVLRLSEFSRLVNLIPGGAVWPPAEERRLWDVYDEVLKTAVVATSALSPEEEKAYKRASALLWDKGPDGTRTDSPAYRAYKQFRDAWFLARQDYNNRKVEADLSDDPAVEARWRDVDEPETRGRIAAVELEWSVTGSRAQVDGALQTLRALAAQSPAQAWSGYSALFDKDVESMTDVSNQRFVPTAFSPSNALDDGSWQQFTLTGDEARKLIASAPEELRAKLAPDAVNLEIESLSFEYSSAAVTRPWLSPEVFEARFWKFADDGKVLCDGNRPAAGACPAYVAGLVFARNFRTVLKPSPANDAAVVRMMSVRPLSMGAFSLTAAGAAAPPPPPTPPPAPPAPAATPALMSRAAMLSGVGIRREARAFGPGRFALAAHATAVADATPAHTATVVAAGPVLSARAVDRFRVAGFRRAVMVRPVRAALPTAPVPAPTPAPPAPVVETPDNLIHVIAFICKSLPKCPNPDASLTW